MVWFPFIVDEGRLLNANPVNFIGPRDDFVVSGSDDGYFFIWEKSTGKLHDILEGDSTVVNVIEANPSLPLLAVSGIDTTVKVRYNISLTLCSRTHGDAVICSPVHWYSTVLQV